MTRLPRLAIFLLVVASAATAQNDELSRQSLKGLNGLGVLVEPLRADVEQGGLNRTSIQTDVELKLRQAGITVMTREESQATRGGAYVYINVNTQSIPNRSLYAYSIHVNLCQNVRLDRDPSIWIVGATTWSVMAVGVVGRNMLRDIRDSIKDYVDQFINAYLSVNPKG
jgi:hypothetical protein